MKRVILIGLLFIIIFSISLPCNAFEGSFPPQDKQLTRGNHLKDACEKADIESLQRRSRGSYGGGDLLRPR
ncbi:hypothetical protein MANES_14G145300v8 [Manihot esculenta]|uniref:Uncharacterized protein n=1 Tax=Manihot esculenta TaxID=3983 RepID=A0A2C9ULC5_MANES|nr:hypothetical protein MANES_14G145300v8 [Manihot esculenta]